MDFFSFETDPKVLLAAAGHGAEISAGLSVGVKALDSEHHGIGKQGEGFTFVDELSKVERSWSDRIESMRKECESISHSLVETARNYEESEEKSSSSFSGSEAGLSSNAASPQKYPSDFG